MLSFHRKNQQQEVWINISNRTVVRVLLLVVVSIVLLAAVRKASHALILIFAAFFLALALNAPVHWLAKHLPGKRRGNRGVATTVSFLVVVLALAGFLIAVAPPLTRSITTFTGDVPRLVQETRNKNSTVGQFISKYNLQNQIDSFAKQFGSRLSNVPGTAVSTVGKLLSSAVSILATLALTFMMLVEGPYWVKRARSLLPTEHDEHVDRLGADMYKVIRGYVNGQVLLAAIAALLITPALFILHISTPLALMVVVFVCGLIPLVGHSIGAAIVTIVALFHSPWSAVIILAYYILYQQIENYVIQPRIQANSTNLSPLLVFAAVIIGVSFGGLLGGLVAIPIMGCLRVLVIDYLHSHGKLEDVSATKEPATPDTAKA